MFSKLSKSGEPQVSVEVYVAGINSHSFEAQALALFRLQYAHNDIYRSYCDVLRIRQNEVQSLTQIPFLPISFFKTHPVLTGGEAAGASLIFESSGTTGEVSSRHFVADEALYKAALLRGFTEAFGPPEDYVFLALLPSYLERKTASLVHMARVLMASSATPESGFFLHEWKELAAQLQSLRAAGRKTILLGVTFALLDFAEAYPINLSGITVMETGGMKGRREEWTRSQVHEYLQARWGLETIATEYGMTELLSQAYAQREGLLTPAPTMRVLVRELNDPLAVTEAGSGALNIIDLANVYSCAFIATEDVGTVHDASSFEVLGRMDNAALRGCSLMTV